MSKYMNIIVDLKNARDTKDVITSFAGALKIQNLNGSNWDTFNDYFRNLNADSEIYAQLEEDKSLHLMIQSPGELAKKSEKDYSTLCEILCEATDAKNRGDGIKLTFEFQNNYL